MEKTVSDQVVQKKAPSQFVKDLGTILFGMLLIIILVPAMQWLDKNTFGNNFEMDIPVPGAVGILTFLVLINAAFFISLKKKLLPLRRLLILYIMLSVSVPFSCVGLVQGFFSSISGIASEYIDRKVTTIRTGYEKQNPMFFPKMKKEKYAEYMQLFEDIKNDRGDPGENKAKQINLTVDLRRFWSGVNIDPDEKKRFDDPKWNNWDRAKASFHSIPWSIWKAPLISWGIFFILIMLMTAFLAQILSKDWTEKENLPFPAAQLPLAMMQDGDGGQKGATPAIFTNIFFWGGAGLAMLLLLYSGLIYYKYLPALNNSAAVTLQRIDFRQIMTVAPWTFISQNLLLLSPCMIGLALLVNQEILKGVLLCFAGTQALRMFGGMFDAQFSASAPHFWQGWWILPNYNELAVGSGIVFVVFLLWRSRNSFSFKAPKGFENGDNYVKPKIAYVGLIVVLVLMFIWWYMLGLRGPKGLIIMLFVLGMTFFSSIIVARSRTEAGLPTANAPIFSWMSGFHLGGFANGLSNMMSSVYLFSVTTSALPGLLATQIEGIYIAKKTRTPLKMIMFSVVVAFITALVVGFISYLVYSYWMGSQNFSSPVQDWSKNPIWTLYGGGDVNWDRFPLHTFRIFMILLGAAVMGLLLFLRKKTPRFSIPPIAFLITCVGVLAFQRAGAIGGDANFEQLQHYNFIWGPMLIAWIIKSLVLKFGGMDLYVKAIPAAFGLVFGHVVMIVFWTGFHFFTNPQNINIFTAMFQ